MRTRAWIEVTGVAPKVQNAPGRTPNLSRRALAQVQPRGSRRLRRRLPGGLGLRHPLDVLGEQPFLALHLLIIDGLPVLEGAESVPFNAGEVNEDVLALGVDDEPEPLLGIEPLDVAGWHDRSPTKCAGLRPRSPRGRGVTGERC